MKPIFVFLLFLLPCFVFAQSKPHRYFDENMSPISKKEYKRDRESGEYLHLDFYLDTAIYHVKVLRSHSGQIPAETLQLLKKDLETAKNATIPADALIVIDYYPGPDPCNQSGTNDRSLIQAYHEDYQKKLLELNPVAQFYIYKTKEGLGKHEGIYAWYPDLNHSVEQTFFPLHYPCDSFVIIRPDGRYRSFFGEYSSDYVCRVARELKAE